MEIGEDTGYRHWQLLLVLDRKQRLSYVRERFPGGHWELSRSSAADEYVWKETTRVEGTQFELGIRKLKRNCATDWELVRKSAQAGNLSEIPADVYVRCFHQLQSIKRSHVRPIAMLRECHVYWGKSGTGKSRRAFTEATELCYYKDPRTKWWDGYQGQPNVIIDEFRGTIDISHILRWLDRYPVSVETKGGSEPLCATKFWFTSNLDPKEWYPLLDEETFAALKRRFTLVIKFDQL